MITDTIEPVSATTTKPCNLLLHCGSHAVSRGELAQAPTPPPTSTWRPIAHLKLLQVVEVALLTQGFAIAGQAHGLTHDNARYFGLIEVSGFTHNPDYHYVVGVRNSHDMRFSAGLVAGSQVLVCDNLSFSGEIQLARKHTPRILDDLPRLVDAAVGKLRRYWDQHDYRVIRYREARINDRRAHDLVIRAVDTGVMANGYIPKVLSLWRKPRHEAFIPRTLWSLQNTFTEVFKGRVDLLPDRT
ncbi:DUF932 domain-containing protein [Ruficoccus amylovorans]|uniref:DUF932 domain-containing protein n=1 Tax=Ruficoccus amylovorans TaxID=1804625 RepID=A0A842HHU4_9BACT|nr:DUF932 domain-containing protein [Ruficoccus amylovorans]MBC2594479.1 DUF932 domain-containing protein [Ruficoccus amylovorans]MBC2594612.1 DUF932 domain-containing protein [Ruficoccus amylovorans]MBC2595899.1 DUF932 domain-containing protein [Ruficoccus amylovorans]MBC2595950.1 DUF932 domain-containing protein [Ruficoccus amylovorans]